MIIVEGEAGIGKTALLERCLEDAEACGVFTATGDEMERERPFGLISEALRLQRGTEDPDRAELAQLLTWDPNDPSAASGLRFRATDEIVDLIERLAARAPLVLALDDLQWADAETLGVLRRLCRDIRHLPVLVAATVRPSPRSDELRALVEKVAEAGAVHIRLQPLDAGAVELLTARLVRATPDASLMDAVGRAGGNPFFITETVAALAGAGAIVVTGGSAGATTEIPRDLSRAVLTRIAGLSTSAARVLRFASVLGSSFSAADLAAVSGVDAAELSDHIAECIRNGVVHEADGRLSFRHDVVREAVYSEIPLSVRKALHMKAAKAFDTSGAPIDKIATHVSAGLEPGDAEAVQWLRRAARSPMLAPSVAVELLQRALVAAGSDEASRDAVTAELIVSMNWAGRRAEAREIAEDLLRRCDSPEVVATTFMAVAQGLMMGARYERAIPVFQDALARIHDPSIRATLTANLAMASTIALADNAAELARVAVRLGIDSGNEAAAGVGHAALAHEAWRTGDPATIKSLWLEAQSDRLGPLAHDWGSVVVPAMGSFLADADLSLECSREMEAATREVERTRLPWTNYRRLVSVVRFRFLVGDWDDAAAEAEAGLAFAEENDVRYGWLLFRPTLAAIAIHRGDLETAATILPSEDELIERGRNAYAPSSLIVTALLREAQGRLDEAADVAARAERLGAAGAVLPYLPLAVESVRLALATGNKGKARLPLERLDEVATRAGLASARGFAARARGLVEEDAGLLLRAVEAFRQSPRVPELAAACEDAGLVGLPSSESMPLVEESLALYERLGATRDIARVEARLRAAGIRRGARGRRGRPSSGWESLTPTELKVVGLVAEGLSNPDIASRLFISRNTVQTHLAHVFAKLGVTTRFGLADLAAQHSS